MAWLTAVGAGAGTVILTVQRGEPFALGLALTGFLLLTAATLTFGGWVERNTEVRLGGEGVHYHSPLRDVGLNWERVEQLSAQNTGRGWRIQVTGGGRSFRFRTEGRLSVGDQEMAFGLEGGQALAAQIRSRASLSAPREESGRWLCRRSIS